MKTVTAEDFDKAAKDVEDYFRKCGVSIPARRSAFGVAELLRQKLFGPRNSHVPFDFEDRDDLVSFE
jgi:hypothetical protein